MPNCLNTPIADEEFLYRGIIEINWDYMNDRPSSAIFKESKGVSVDRDNYRPEKECIKYLKERKDFFGICKVKTGKVREYEALVKYIPVDDNIYHSEIHDSENRIPMKGKKPKKIRDNSTVVFKK